LAKQSVVASDVFHGLGGSATVTADAAPTLLSAYLRTGKVDQAVYAGIALESKAVATAVIGKQSLSDIPVADRATLRKEIYLVSESITKLGKTADGLPAANKADLQAYAKKLNGFTNFIPMWVKIVVALALGLGTMVGWKRIVVTVGEKIGKAHLTYGQGVAAETTAAGMIFASDMLGLPASTTHVLSSGIAGTMMASGSGLQWATVRSIAIAWVLTLPASALIAGILFAVFRAIF
jgi:PiT family inorganic phosphate transporter